MKDFLTPVIDSDHPVVDADGFDGFKPGCLPRQYNFGELFSPASENIQMIPRSQWATYAGNISLRPHVDVVLDQDGAGSCATEATAGAMMIARAMAGLPHVEFNPWFIYHTTSGGRDRGSSVDENLRFILQHGCAPVSVWPRSKGWRADPSGEAKEAAMAFTDFEVFDIGSIDEMVSALLTGFAVVYGSNGHAVCKIEHLDDSKGLDLNSWGTSWKDGGFGVWATYRAVNFSYGAYALRAARGGV